MYNHQGRRNSRHSHGTDSPPALLSHTRTAGRKTLLTAFLVATLAAGLTNRAQAGGGEGGVSLSLGTGRLSESGLAFDPDVTGLEGFHIDDEWTLLQASVGYWFNRGNSEVTLDALFSGFGRQSSMGTRPLVGGGTTAVSSSISHTGVFLGMRERVLWRLFATVGIGFFAQDKTFSYDPPVANGGGGFTETYSAWTWGAGFRATNRVLFGFKKYETVSGPKGGPEAMESGPMARAFTGYLTAIF